MSTRILEVSLKVTVAACISVLIDSQTMDLRRFPSPGHMVSHAAVRNCRTSSICLFLVLSDDSAKATFLSFIGEMLDRSEIYHLQ